MKLKIFKLTFHTPLHLSRGKVSSYESSDTVLHSDKLKSALYATAIQLFGSPSETETAILKGEKEGEVKHIANVILKNIRLSSAFPFDKAGCWLPKPLSFQPKVENPTDRKKYKEVKYLTVAQFRELQKCKQPQNLLQLEQPAIWHREVTQRVKVGYEEDSEPFYLEKLYAHPNAGIYFIAQEEGKVEVDWNQFSHILQLLGENGIGLQRGLGNGHFTIQEDTIELESIENPTSWMALSLYRPTDKDEVKPVLEKSFYQFIKRGGWISSPENDMHLSLRKKSVLMFTEGSVFGFKDITTKPLAKGKIEDLAPANNLLPNDKVKLTHSVWRDGRAIFLPLE